MRALTVSDDSRQAIADMVSGGWLPGIPVRLGDSVNQATDTWGMLTDPDLCEAGRLFSL